MHAAWSGWQRSNGEMTAHECLVRLGKNDANDGKQTKRTPSCDYGWLCWMRNEVARVGSREGMVQLRVTSPERGVAERADGNSGLVK